MAGYSGDFVHLHLHSEYSLLDGAIKVDDLVERVREYNMPAVAITDHGNMFSALEFYQKAHKAGVKPILGCECYVASEDHLARNRHVNGKLNVNNHVILLAMNYEGYKNLSKLVTESYLNGFYYKPRIDKDFLRDHSDGLIALSSCLMGEVNYFSNPKSPACDSKKAYEAAERYKDMFGDRFYLEIQNNGVDVQPEVANRVRKISKELNIPLVATNDAHYLNRGDAQSHDVLLCLQTGKTVDREDRMRFASDQFYVKSAEEMKAVFPEFPDAVAATLEIADRCNVELPLGEYHFPSFDLPEGETLESRLLEDARTGYEARMEAVRERDPEYFAAHEQEYRDRLDAELGVIQRMGFAGYFLIVADFIKYAKNKGIPVGPGRGSAVGSLAAYSLGITDVDPLPYGLLFERFLTEGRNSMPDIDVDICMEGRDDVIKYVTDKYGGNDHVTQIITFGRMKARAAIRNVGRAMNMPYGEVDKIAKLVPDTLNITLEEAFTQEPEFTRLRKQDQRIDDLLTHAVNLEGLPQNASTHAAGVVIADKPLIDYLPLYKGSKEDDVVATQYDMNMVEAIGLIKFDFLGLKTLTLIRNVVHTLKEKNRVPDDFDIGAIPLDDAKTYELLSAADTSGVFQLESSGMKDLIRRLKPSEFEDVIAVNALYRPGPLKSGMADKYINRKHGRETTTYLHPDLEPLLHDTHGIILYQEQVMRIARSLAGFTATEADVLRKAMGKKKMDLVEEMRGKFLDGAETHGMSRAAAEELYNLMAEFGGYGFNKSHSAAYGLIAYQTAYLKAHWPAEFMAELLTIDGDNSDKIMRYIGELRDAGYSVEPPDINQSGRTFTADGKTLRYGLAAVKGVGHGAVDAILEARAEAPYRSLFDFCERVDLRRVNKKVVENLIKAGAFDYTGANRAQMFAAMEHCLDAGQQQQRDRDIGQESLFGGGGLSADAAEPPLPDVPEWPSTEKLGYEKIALGLYISGHPLEGHEEQLRKYTDLRLGDASQKPDGIQVRIGGVVTALRETTSKKGDRMAFITLEDLTGSLEVIVFPDAYRNAVQILKSEAPVLVTGKLETGEEIKLLASSVLPLENAQEACTKSLHVWVRTSRSSEADLDRLLALLSDNPGDTPVLVHVLDPRVSETIIALPERCNVTPSVPLSVALEEMFGPNTVSTEVAQAA